MTDNALPLMTMQSRDHGKLLDVIDQLRSQGISHYVSLPQLIVCGDQSSGKSSVLEAISGVRFPTKDTVCTRFATELILRRDPTAKVAVTITAGAERTQEEKQRLNDFKAPTLNLEELPVLVDAAKEAMGLTADVNAFSDDVLRVEVNGPDQPHLTLVDLPGLYHAESKQQSARDRDLVASLIEKYMRNTRSIILAVVSAKNDYVMQIVTRKARDVDPKGRRTLGIITKPDTLHTGSESESDFLSLARNEEVSFRLGWHVLVNRDYGDRDCSTEERNEAESAFLSKGIWTSLPATSLGIDALKPRLSVVLKDHILSELPGLTSDVENGIEDCHRRLAKLGEARGTVQEQRNYLTRLSHSFSGLLKAAVDGIYVDKFFGDAISDLGYSKRLRAVVQNVFLAFAKTVRHEGHKQAIVENKAKMPASTDNKSNNQAIIENKSDSGDATGREPITRSEFVEHVRLLMKRSRGRELPGTFNPLIIGDLFFRQAEPWKDLAEKCCVDILAAIRATLTEVLTHTTDEATMKGLLQVIVNPAMEEYAGKLKDTLTNVIRPHREGHPITYNHYFIETIQKVREQRNDKLQRERLYDFFKLDPKADSTYLQNRSFYTGDLLSKLSTATEKDMEGHACSEAIDCMNAYYEVAMKVFIDNMAALSTEHCLLKHLPDMFSPATVMSLDENTVQDIALEPESSKIERIRVSNKLESLESGLQTLKRIRGQNAQGNDDFGSASIVARSSLGARDADAEKESSVDDGRPMLKLHKSTVVEDFYHDEGGRNDHVEAPAAVPDARPTAVRAFSDGIGDSLPSDVWGQWSDPRPKKFKKRKLQA